MRGELIVPGVYRILRGYANAYAVVAEDDLTLVDSGTPGHADELLDAVRAGGRSPSDVRTILVTHHHLDHVGSLAALARATGATVYLPAADAPAVRGDVARPAPNRHRLLGRLLGPLLVRMQPMEDERPRIDVEVVDGQRLPVAGGVTAVATPGHTAGQTSYLLRRHGGILLAGDVAVNLLRPKPPTGQLFGMFTEDLDQAERSFARIGRLEFEVLCPGHGRPIREGASRAIAAVAQRYAQGV